MGIGNRRAIAGRVMAGCIAALTAGAPAFAGDLVGTWVTPPDGKGIIGHIEVTPCGGMAVCGVIASTYDSQGKQVVTRNIGVRVFWDMVRVDRNRWQGMAYVPLYKQTYRGEITLNGNRAKVGGCFGPICKSQIWKRL
jgi:uncharacterized protein (DUF2147 family)